MSINYEANIKELEKYYVTLDNSLIGPEKLSSKLIEIVNNLNIVSQYLVEAILNLNKHKAIVKSLSAERSIEYSSALVSEDVIKLKSAELRQATANLKLQPIDNSLNHANTEYTNALAYHDAVKLIYDTLISNMGILKEHIKLYQNMLYVEYNNTATK